MKQIFKRLNSFLIASAICLISTAAFSAAAESTIQEDVELTIAFDFDDEEITIEEGGTLEDITTKADSSVFLPKTKLERDGYEFSGWTADGFRGYAPGDVFRVTNESVTFKPVWLDIKNAKSHIVNFTAEIDGEPLDISENLPPEKCIAGSLYTVNHFAIIYDGKKHIGWLYNGEIYRGDSKIVMPDHDITLSANWYDYRKITYKAGDVDKIIGVSSIEFEYVETFGIDLPTVSRFARKGYTISGWLCENDGVTYKPLGSYIMPKEDVVMYAVWKPINYTVVFNSGTGSSKDNIKIKGDTDTIIIVPECTAVKEGFKFSGWSYDDKVYQPGDDFLIEGADPGLGISLKAVWTENSGTTNSPEDVRGDTNCDGSVNLADAVLIMQNIANPNKYKITSQGKLNGDVDETGDGLTTNDAYKIQQFVLGMSQL